MKRKIVLPFIFFFIIFAPQRSLGVNNIYKKQLSKKKSELSNKQKELKALKSKEKKIYKNILNLEKNIEKIKIAIENNNKQLKSLQEKEINFKKDIADIQKNIREKSKYLSKILNLLWDTYLKKYYLSSPLDFKDIQLKYIWLEDIYKNYNKRLAEIREKQKLLNIQKKKLEILKEQIKLKTEKIQAQKDELLKEKMVLFSRLQNIRAQSIKKEKQLEEIIDTVERLKYNLKILKTKKFQEAKGFLPWPVKPSKFKRVKKGIVIFAPQGTKVISCFFGKVVFQDKLRGFGNVVIIYHGDGYYTLYAFLSKVFVNMGQIVERSETIGEVGFSPFVKTYGLYLEIRKGKRPIDPEKWLRRT
ncbi:murein hydrolase activator EnvC family protein [Desulfothermus okinawensis]